MSNEAREHYYNLKESGELKEFFPRATGDWDNDKSQFLKFYEENIKLIKDFETGNLSIDDIDDYDELNPELF